MDAAVSPSPLPLLLSGMTTTRAAHKKGPSLTRVEWKWKRGDPSSKGEEEGGGAPLLVVGSGKRRGRRRKRLPLYSLSFLRIAALPRRGEKGRKGKGKIGGKEEEGGFSAEEERGKERLKRNVDQD